jgi:type I restriction enzyme R subunit
MMSVLPDPHKGALTQIFQEHAPDERPEIIERVVELIDDIVRPVRGSGRQSSFPGDRELPRSRQPAAMPPRHFL